MNPNKTAVNAVKKRRIPEIDFIKAFCILAMIIVHCYEEFYDGTGSASSTLLVDIFNVIIGASAFMFCMGFTMDLGKEKSGGACLQRGGILLFAGLLLNFLRSPLILCVHFFTDDPNIVFAGMIDVLSVDILPFAGMAFLLMGVLKKCKLKPWGIFIVALVISAIGTALRYTDTGIPVVNSLLAFIIGSNAESYFPLCHWFVFVAAGNVYRVYYTKIEDKKKYYKVALPVAAVISVVFVILASREIGPFQCLGSELYYYTWMNPCDALGSIACVITYMGVMWLLSLLAEKIQPKVRPLSYLAENLTVLYFIHWLFLMTLEYVFLEGFELIPWPETDIAIFLYAIGFLLLTILICEIYKKYWRKGLLRFMEKNAVVLAVVVIILVVTCVVLSATHGLTEVPSFLNDYEVNGITYL